MDGLSIEENTGLEFASIHKGIMHASGHDCLMAMVLGAAEILSKLKKIIHGQIKFVFQPAAMAPGGALLMLQEGVLENPGVDYAIACHLASERRIGEVLIESGLQLAAMKRFKIKVKGKGGYRVLNYKYVDAMDVASQIIPALHLNFTRHGNPLIPTFVRISQIRNLSAFEGVADNVEIIGNIRTFDNRERISWPDLIEKPVKGICEANGASYDIEFQNVYPAADNGRSITKLVEECAVEVVGEQRVLTFIPNMEGDDFSWFTNRCQGCLFFMGAASTWRNPPYLHSPEFAPSNDLLPFGVEIFLKAALQALWPEKSYGKNFDSATGMPLTSRKYLLW
jgi:amidohydrolase